MIIKILLLHIPKLTYRTIQSILSRLQMIFWGEWNKIPK